MQCRGLAWCVGILLFAAVLRTAGLSFGQPDPTDFPSLYPYLHGQVPLHPDEYFYVAIPVKMQSLGRLSPNFFENPSFLINLNHLTNRLAGVQVDVPLPESLNRRNYAPFSLYFVGRVYSMLGGLLTVAAAYGLARYAAGRWFAGVVAALLVAVSYPLVQHAHYATTSSLASGFVMVSLWACWLALQQKRRPFVFWVLAGIAAGLAVGNRYNAAAVGFPLFLTGLVSLYRNRNSAQVVRVFAAWIAFPLVFLLTSPFVLLDFRAFWEDFSYIFGSYTHSATAAVTGLEGLVIELQYVLLLGIGVLPVAVGLVGIVWELAHRCRLVFACFALSFILPYSLVVLRTVRPQNGDQLLVVFIPVVVVWLSIGFSALALRFPILVRLLFVFSLAYALYFTLPLTWRFMQQDTREITQDWVYEVLPSGSSILLVGAYNVPLDDSLYDVQQEFSFPRELGSADYIVVSDAVLLTQSFFQKRPYAEVLEVNLGFAADMELIYSVERPRLPAFGLPNDNAIYWHHPAIRIYCANADSCSVIGR